VPELEVTRWGTIRKAHPTKDSTCPASSRWATSCAAPRWWSGRSATGARRRCDPGRIDSFEQGNVISVAAYRDAQTREPIAAHLPFSEPTFRKSAQRLVARNRQLPEGFEEGYRTWRAAFDSGQAGLW
jgi:hypothetical protein